MASSFIVVKGVKGSFQEKNHCITRCMVEKGIKYFMPQGMLSLINTTLLILSSFFSFFCRLVA